jgi:glycine/D-amino acid oxidase-like deaminating enzyme
MLPALKRRVAEEMPGYVRYGIHVMASQNDRGEVIIGDSHEYGDCANPFDKPRIDTLILDYLRTLVRLPAWEVAGRWHGFYAKHPTLPLATAEPQPGCVIATGTGGTGMTLSFGLAADWWEGHDR